MELLDRKLSEKAHLPGDRYLQIRHAPRRVLLSPDELKGIATMRRIMQNGAPPR